MRGTLQQHPRTHYRRRRVIPTEDWNVEPVQEASYPLPDCERVHAPVHDESSRVVDGMPQAHPVLQGEAWQRAPEQPVVGQERQVYAARAKQLQARESRLNSTYARPRRPTPRKKRSPTSATSEFHSEM
jgi:hypothetical protein